MARRLGLLLVLVVVIGLGAGFWLNREQILDPSVGPDTGNSSDVTAAVAREEIEVLEVPEPALDEIPVFETPDQYAIEQLQFLRENAKAEDVKVTESGLQFKILAESGGQDKPTISDIVQYHYRGRLTDGIEFESSYNYGEPSEPLLSELIAGLQEGLQLMNVGDVYEFTIPPELGYGAEGSGDEIPGFSVLIFEIELLDIIQQ